MPLRIGLVVVSFILSLCIGFAARGSAMATTEEKSTQTITIGLSMDTLEEERWQKDRDFFVAKAKALGAEVKVLSAGSDDTQQIKDIQSFITNQVDLIVIVPHDGAAMAKGVKIAHEADIPVIAYDRLITHCDLDLYITFDNVRVGEMQAQYLLDTLPNGKGKVIRIFGAKTDNNALLFKQGQDNILNPAIARGDITILHEDWAENWNPENAKKIANAAITNHGTGFDAILASNDGTAGGAIQCLKEEGKIGKIIVTGQDAEKVACQRIVSGEQAMTIYKPIQALAENAAMVAVKMAKGKAIIANNAIHNQHIEVPSVLLEVTSVDKSNMMDTVIKDGFHNKEDIYK